jgi:hypothetical protein
MTRTTIVLPEDLKLRAQERAREEGIPFAELVRKALESQLRAPRVSAKEDPLFADVPVYAGRVPPDASEEHDAYLADR